MAERGILHTKHLEAFAGFLEKQGFTKQPLSKNPYEVLRMKKIGGRHTVVLFKKADAKEHLSVMDKDMPLVRKFFRKERGFNG